MTTTLPQPVYFQLGPTAAYARRRCGWFPGAGDRCGTLRLVVEPAGRSRSRDAVEVDVYAVQECEAEMPGIREFLLLNETDATQDDVYAVTCVWGVAVKCSCKGSKCGLVCKHRSAIEKLLAEGLL